MATNTKPYLHFVIAADSPHAEYAVKEMKRLEMNRGEYMRWLISEIMDKRATTKK